MVKKKIESNNNQIFFLILKYRTYVFERMFYRLESFFFNRNSFLQKKIRHCLMANLYFLIILYSIRKIEQVLLISGIE